MNKFTDRYKQARNTELLRIIEKSDDYQPLAVESAKTELDSRKLTDSELNSAKEELRLERQGSEQQVQRKQERINKVKNIAYSAIDNLNPIQESPMKTDKLIHLISILFGGIALYQIIKEFGMLKFMFSGQGEWDFSMVLYFLPLVLIPTASIMFWLQKKLGWILLNFYLCFSVVNSISLIIMTWNMKPTGNTSLDTLFPATSPIVYIMTSLFFIGTLWMINKQNLREKYKIDKKIMIGTTVVSIVISLSVLTQF